MPSGDEPPLPARISTDTAPAADEAEAKAKAKAKANAAAAASSSTSPQQRHRRHQDRRRQDQPDFHHHHPQRLHGPAESSPSASFHDLSSMFINYQNALPSDPSSADDVDMNDHPSHPPTHDSADDAHNHNHNHNDRRLSLGVAPPSNLFSARPSPYAAVAPLPTHSSSPPPSQQPPHAGPSLGLTNVSAPPAAAVQMQTTTIGELMSSFYDRIGGGGGAGGLLSGPIAPGFGTGAGSHPLGIIAAPAGPWSAGAALPPQLVQAQQHHHPHSHSHPPQPADVQSSDQAKAQEDIATTTAAAMPFFTNPFTGAPAPGPPQAQAGVAPYPFAGARQDSGSFDQAALTAMATMGVGASSYPFVASSADAGGGGGGGSGGAAEVDTGSVGTSPKSVVSQSLQPGAAGECQDQSRGQSQGQGQGQQGRRPPSFEFTKRKGWASRIVEELQDFMHVLSPDGRLLFASPSVFDLTGWTAEQVVGEKITEFIHADDVACFQREFDGVLHHAAADLTLYYRFMRKDGSYVIFEVTGHPYFVPDSTDGEAKCFFGMARLYPSKNMAMIDSFLELKIENERLRSQLRELYGNNHAGVGAGAGAPCEADVSMMPPTHSSSTQAAANIRSASAAHQYPGTAPGTIPSGALGGDSGSAASPVLSSVSVGIGSRRGSSSIDADSEGDASWDLHGTTTTSGASTTATADGSVGDRPSFDDPSSAAAATTTVAGHHQAKKKHKKSKAEEGEYVCTDCGRVDSPEWRKGPLGPKTLCNACGLRWAKKVKRKEQQQQQQQQQATGGGGGGGGGGTGAGSNADPGTNGGGPRSSFDGLDMTLMSMNSAVA